LVKGKLHLNGDERILGDSDFKESRRARARSLACYWAVRELGMTTAAMPKVLGICPTAATKAVSRGEVFAKSRLRRSNSHSGIGHMLWGFS
jgi:hypothetical protein